MTVCGVCVCAVVFGGVWGMVCVWCDVCRAVGLCVCVCVSVSVCVCVLFRKMV